MNKTTFYTTIENQVRSDESKAILYDHFTDINDAYAKLYGILAEASKSEIPYHSAHIMRSDGIIIDGKVFDRRENMVNGNEWNN